MVFTAAGHRMLAQVQLMLDVGENLYDFAGEVTQQLRGSLTIGCLVTLAPMLLPALSQSFIEANPRVELHLFEGNQDELAAGLRTREVDLALTYDMSLPQGIAFSELVALPPHVLTGVNHPFAQRSHVTLAEVADEPCIMLDLPHSRAWFLSLFERRELTPDVVRRSTQPEVVRTMVANGYGVTIAVVRPRCELALDGARLIATAPEGEIESLPLGYAESATVTANDLSTAFKQHLRQQITPAHVPGMRTTLRG